MKKIISKKRLVIFSIILSGVLVILAAGAFVVNRYLDAHTIVTINLSGSSYDGGIAGAFYESWEYVNGDNITFGDVTLAITDIKRDGTVYFNVAHGLLKDNETGQTVFDGVLNTRERKWYRVNNGSISLHVSRKWIQT